MSKQFVLIWKWGNELQIVAQGSVSLCQREKERLKAELHFTGGQLILRTKEGFEACPHWQPPKKEKAVRANRSWR